MRIRITSATPREDGIYIATSGDFELQQLAIERPVVSARPYRKLVAACAWPLWWGLLAGLIMYDVYNSALDAVLMGGFCAATLAYVEDTHVTIAEVWRRPRAIAFMKALSSGEIVLVDELIVDSVIEEAPSDANIQQLLQTGYETVLELQNNLLPILDQEELPDELRAAAHEQFNNKVMAIASGTTGKRVLSVHDAAVRLGVTDPERFAANGQA